MSKNRKVHFVSLGCPKNLVDSEIMLGTLLQKGYEVTEDETKADAIVVNTCGFIEEAKQESISRILEASHLKEGGQLKKLVVAGCLTQRYQEELVQGLPEADLFVGSGQFQQIGTLLDNAFAGETKKDFFHLPTYLQQEDSPRVNSQKSHRAYLKISEGCKKRCAFCAIPMIRGNLQSRKIDSVISEAKLLVAGGVKELIVISHDFTDYGWDLRKKDPHELASPNELLRRLAKESGAEWIRVLYMYPDGVNEELMDLMEEHENLLPYFDMPLQHINNQVLKSMNRRMTREQIEEAIELIRSRFPNGVIRTQFIVGFPGETESQFEELLDFVEASRFDRVGCFKYSQEEQTKAATMPHQVSEELKEERHDALMELQKSISRAHQEALIGQTLNVMVEGLSEETDLLIQGRHSLQAPDIDGLTYINEGTASVGEIVPVRITDCHDYDLVGEVVSASPSC